MADKDELKRNWITGVIWLLLLLLMLYSWVGLEPNTGREKVSYSQFKTDIRQGKVAEITVSGQDVTGTYKKQGKEKEAKTFQTALPSINDPELMTLIDKQGVTMNVEPQENSWWTTALISFLPWLLMIGFFVYIGRRMQQQMGGAGGPGGMFQFAKSKAKRYFKGSSNTTFEDVAGLDSAKRDLKEIVDFLAAPDRYQKLGAKLPRGVLLVGPPGTGKTLLAKAVAGEADVPFFSISGSEFIEMLVGVGASRVRDMFENAKREAPAVIFIDEIDSVGRARGTGLGGGNDEREQTLNQILSEMDGFSPNEAVVALAATNRPDVLDAALLRPGRFDRKVVLERPHKDARHGILEVHSRHVKLADDVDLEVIARRTAGFSGADLENLVNEAALLAGREDQEQVAMRFFDMARDKVVLGAERESFLSDEDKRRVAYHESGHALLALVLPHTDPLDRVTIIPHGMSLGATELMPEEERQNLPESYLRDRVTVMLGGRVAEKVVFGEVSSGAEEDLRQATSLARRMVSRWGMSEKLGPVAFRREEDNVFLGREMAQPPDFSEDTARLIDDEIRSLLRGLEETARTLLTDHRAQLDSLAQALLEKETLDTAEIRALVESPAWENGLGWEKEEEARQLQPSTERPDRLRGLEPAGVASLATRSTSAAIPSTRESQKPG